MPEETKPLFYVLRSWDCDHDKFTYEYDWRDERDPGDDYLVSKAMRFSSLDKAMAHAFQSKLKGFGPIAVTQSMLDDEPPSKVCSHKCVLRHRHKEEVWIGGDGTTEKADEAEVFNSPAEAMRYAAENGLIYFEWALDL